MASKHQGRVGNDPALMQLARTELWFSASLRARPSSRRQPASFAFSRTSAAVNGASFLLR